jgi:hypothetical protein
MSEGSWLPDPTGAHELRYWNGSTWTEHVSDQGTTGHDPLTTELPPPTAAFPPPPTPPPAAAPAAATAPTAKLSWKDRLKQVADQGKAIADQGKQKLAEQQAKRTAQWADDPNTLWFGESKSAPTSAGAAFGAPTAPPPPAQPQPDLADQLRKLADLRDAGILTEEEFAAQKAKLLG